MPTQPSTESRESTEETKKERQIARSSPTGVERVRPRNWLGFPRRARSMLAPYDLFSSNPFELMRRVSDDLDRMFGDTLLPQDLLGGGWSEQSPLWAPDIEIYERDDDVVVRADLPGVKKEDLRIDIIGNDLVLEGERKKESEQKEAGFYRSERTYGTFRRVITLPAGVGAEDASATFNAGVLEIKVKNPNPQPKGRHIEIKSNDKTSSDAPKIH